MVFDQMPVALDMNLFEQQDWSYLPYGCKGLAEELPNNMPKPCGPLMTMQVFVDADHAGDLLIPCSETGFIVFLMEHQFIGAQRSRLPVKLAPLAVSLLK